MAYRITVDVGGTFTDVVLSERDGTISVGKSPTDPDRAFAGIAGGLEAIAAERGTEVADLLAAADLFVYSTTRATNAILEGKTARTALLVTEGFPDILLLREGGKVGAFDFDTPYGAPYIPRDLTFEVPERIGAQGEIVSDLDPDAVRSIAATLRTRGVEAVAVSLLWSIVNPVHEAQVAGILDEELPGIPYTLSHELTPIMREYRRTSTTAIDASLKPVMGAHLRGIAADLTAAGFHGELLAATSFGGVMHLEDLAERPVATTKSGPALAPVAGRVFAAHETGADQVVVCDMGGTSFDVSLVRDGNVNFNRETWLGGRFVGHIVATSSVDVRSIGAGGGSIAWIDPGGLLRVGPESAGADPGPAAYGRGGDRPTVTDAAVVLGYLAPEHFLGGRMTLDPDAAMRVVGELGGALGLDPEAAAAAMLTVANEHMVAAIAEITINEGVDPRESLLVAGGGAAGLTIGEIAREIGCPRVLIPRTAGALSAMGGQFSDIVAEFSQTHPTTTDGFDHVGVDGIMNDLEARAGELSGRLRARGIDGIRFEYSVEARYAFQVWDLELPLPSGHIRDDEDVAAVAKSFDALHQRIFAVSEPGQTVELLTWKVRLVAELGTTEHLLRSAETEGGDATGSPVPVRRRAFFPARGWEEIDVFDGPTLRPGTRIAGPALVVEPTTTIVVHPAMTVTVSDRNNYLMEVSR